MVMTIVLIMHVNPASKSQEICDSSYDSTVSGNAHIATWYTSRYSKLIQCTDTVLHIDDFSFLFFRKWNVVARWGLTSVVNVGLDSHRSTPSLSTNTSIYGHEVHEIKGSQGRKLQLSCSPFYGLRLCSLSRTRTNLLKGKADGRPQ